MSDNTKPMTATEIRQNWDRFNEQPEVKAVNEAFDKIRRAIFKPLIKRAKELIG